MSSRDIQLDVLKGLGIILVVFAHTAHNIASDFVYLFHMPLFFFLSGAALSFSWDADYHLGKRLYRIMVPYVAFSLLSFFYWRLVESRFRPVHDGDLFPMLSGMLDMGWQQFLNIFLAFSFEDAFLYNVVLWFLPCLLVSTMIYTCVRRNLGRYEIVGVALVALLGFALSGFRLPFCSEIAFAAVPFLWCGRLLYKRLCASAALVGGGILALAMAVMVMFSPHVDMRIHAYGSWWLFYLVALGLIIPVVIFSRWLVGKEYGILQWLGRNSLVVMCVHEPIKRILLKVFAMVTNMEISDIRQSAVLSIIITVLVIATCVPAVMMMRRFTPWLIGKK